MGLFRSTKPPLDDEVRHWIDESARWIVEEFGLETIRERTVAVPHPQHFPDEFDGTEATLEPMVQRVCEFMSIDRARFRLKIFVDNEDWLGMMPVGETDNPTRATGTYAEPKDGVFVISLEEHNLSDPLQLVATLAHEISHIHLLGDRRIDPEVDEDHEFLTDLLTIFLGLGIFTGNTAIRLEKIDEGSMQGWQSSAAGYLPEDAIGYALALFTMIRGQPKPVWAQFLNSNIAHYFKKSVKYLSKTPPDFLASLESTS